MQADNPQPGSTPGRVSPPGEQRCTLRNVDGPPCQGLRPQRLLHRPHPTPAGHAGRCRTMTGPGRGRRLHADRPHRCRPLDSVGEQHAGEHQAAAHQGPAGKQFAEQQPAAQGGEGRLQAEQDGRMRGVGPSLHHHLQGVARATEQTRRRGSAPPPLYRPGLNGSRTRPVTRLRTPQTRNWTRASRTGAVRGDSQPSSSTHRPEQGADQFEQVARLDVQPR